MTGWPRSRSRPMARRSRLARVVTVSRRARPRPRSPMRWTWSRRRAMPVTLIVVPGTVTVIVAPVRTDGEGDDRQADHRPVVQHGHRIALIGIAEQPAIDPSACARQADVAPRIARDTAVDRHRHTGPGLSNDRVVGRRACPHIGRGVDDCLPGLRRRHAGHHGKRRQHGRGRDDQWQGLFVHVRLPVFPVFPDSAVHGDGFRPLRTLHAGSTRCPAQWFAVMRNETLPEYCCGLRGRIRLPSHARDTLRTTDGSPSTGCPRARWPPGA